MPAIAVKLCNLSKAFANRSVLEDVNLSVSRGESLVLLGPSGSGKSVLLRLIMGLEQPDDGQVVIGGNGEARQRGPIPHRAALVFQRNALLDNLTVAQNVAFPLRHDADQVRVRRRIERILEDVGLGGEAGKKPRELSGGMAKRVAIARALAGRPLLLLYDEPTAGLDPDTADHIAGLIRRFHHPEKGQRTSITVTHDYRTAAWIADRVMYLDVETHQIRELKGSEEIAELCQTQANPGPAAPDLERRRAALPALLPYLKAVAAEKRVFDRQPSASGSAVARWQHLSDAVWHALAWPLTTARALLRAMGELRPPGDLAALARRICDLGGGSLVFIAGSGLLVGMAMALQLAAALAPFGMEESIPDLLTVSLLREIAPLVTGLLLAGRIGAGMAAEVGTMANNEQLDALHTMGEPPGRCLLTPIFQANLLIQPVLTFLFTLAALVGGNLIFTQVLHRRTLAYQARVLDALNADDVLLALLKALTFGATIALVGYQTGRQDTRSAEDVGRASRTAVVLASTIIILADLVLSHVLAVW